MHKLFPNSTFFDFEAIRILGTSVYGGADAAEVLEAVGQIKANDPSSWEKAWQIQAKRAEALANEAQQHGDRDASKRAYLRAANYTRASGYMYVSSISSVHETAMVQDPRALPIAEKVGELFRKAISLMDGAVLALSIPYENYMLPAYLYLPPANRRIPSRSKIPVLINCGGADSCQEELFFLNPAAGPGLGYAVLTFDGPGQGMMLRRYGLHMRPDWEIVTGCVIDYLVDLSAQNPDLNLDMDCISVSGASMGAYFALRAAADPRIKACVSIDPFYDMWDFGTAHVSPLFISAWQNGWITHNMVDKLIGAMKMTSFQLRWEISVTGTFFGLSSPADILLHMKKFTFSGPGLKGSSGYLSRVLCPVLISGAGKSLYMDADDHTRRCFEGLVNVPFEKKEVWIPSSEGQGSLQAKMGALALCNQRTYEFLDRALGIERQPL
ncbi:alpha/beta hydrolase [Colletotrichum truncatum]|uniref:Alpha/beta hydrolase n=1 Tax=Colletotrichum truncatum TaxID=5467 RepID=A0ACC3ZC16_COLTU|nr:alpha/beta hydrolase [Colletotrichum truncatum]KAF6783837.1 alpha/beta hydrolase [Colletotrichum truncatum]